MLPHYCYIIEDKEHPKWSKVFDAITANFIHRSRILNLDETSDRIGFCGHTWFVILTTDKLHEDYQILTIDQLLEGIEERKGKDNKDLFYCQSHHRCQVQCEQCNEFYAFYHREPTPDLWDEAIKEAWKEPINGGTIMSSFIYYLRTNYNLIKK